MPVNKLLSKTIYLLGGATRTVAGIKGVWSTRCSPGLAHLLPLAGQLQCMPGPASAAAWQHHPLMSWHAGKAGSGASACVNSWILTILLWLLTT